MELKVNLKTKKQKKSYLLPLGLGLTGLALVALALMSDGPVQMQSAQNIKKTQSVISKTAKKVIKKQLARNVLKFKKYKKSIKPRIEKQVEIKDLANAATVKDSDSPSPKIKWDKKYQNIKNCIFSQDCGLGRGDAYSEDYQAQQVLLKHLNEKLVNSFSEKEKEKIVLEVFEFGDGYIQGWALNQALKMKKLSFLKKAVFAELPVAAEAGLNKSFLKVLQKIVKEEGAKDTTKLIETLFSSGGHFMIEEFSKKPKELEKLIGKNALKNLNPRNKNANNSIKSYLADIELKSSGG